MADSQYLILQHPGHNRVYFKAAEKLALAELEIAAGRISVPLEQTGVVHLAGIRYIAMKTSRALSAEDLRILASLSFFWAVYLQTGTAEAPVLVPLEATRDEHLDSMIGTLLKYQGKTNELFTRMMINVARHSGKFSTGPPLQLLDPVAGKGTTLFQAGILGMHAYGIEKDRRQVHEAAVFFKKYLETEKWKHRMGKRLVTGSVKGKGIHLVEFEYARTREGLAGSPELRRLGLIAGDAADAFRYFKNERFHLLVGDLPYGIVHGAKTSDDPTRKRGPVGLLEESLDGWHRILVSGGAVVVSWNTFVASRDRVRELFASHGFEVLAEGPYDRFEHMVDRSIKRNIVVALKSFPGSSDKN